MSIGGSEVNGFNRYMDNFVLDYSHLFTGTFTCWFSGDGDCVVGGKAPVVAREKTVPATPLPLRGLPEP